MRITVARLRLWIVVLAALLVAAVVGFLGYARYRAGKLVSDLPSRLGGEITSTSDGFTYSQSVKGRTAFTIHASKAVKFAGGASATLRDVVITLYGAQGDRSDRISGSEFDYDQKAGIVTAKGEVQIDLQGADATGSPVGAVAEKASAAAGIAAPAQQVVHVKTSGLVFDQNQQLATTSQHVEFSTLKGSGQAMGASYDVRKGLLVLQSAVELDSDRDGDPVVVHASHVEFLRPSMQAFLLHPVTAYRTDTTAADQAIVYFRKDGSAEHIDARGNIRFATAAGQQMTARAAKILLDPKSQPQRADIGGGVNFVSSGASRQGFQQQMRGNAVEATLTFGPGGVLSHGQARDAVSFVDQQQGLADDPGGSATREVRASRIDADFVPDKDGRAQADKVLAQGGATAVLHTIRTKGPSQNTTIKGDQLLATLRGGRSIASLHGSGHTSVLDLAANGASNLSSGDTLQVNFAPVAADGSRAATPAKQASKPGAMAGGGDAGQIQSVVQEGNVVIVQTPSPDAAKSASASNFARPSGPTRAFARRADYDGASQVLRLTGSPRIDDGATEMAADAIDYHRDSQIANANGNVKATYRQLPATAAAASKAPSTAVAATPPGIGGEGPAHVVSASAVLDQARGLAVFRGQARLWQGANSVSAPIIELSSSPESLKAYAEPAAANAVFTVMASSSGPQRQPTVFRVRSRQLLYAGADREATFTGAVTAEDASGVVHADQVEAFLVPAAPSSPAPQNQPGAAKAPSEAASRIDRILATGHVVLQQPGRRGTGETLLYRASEGKFTLTGTPAVPPHLYDQAHGNVSGEALIFNTQDDSVMVTGGQSRAVTNTRTAK